MSHRPLRIAAPLLASVLALSVACAHETAGQPAAPRPGSKGVGDPIFPTLGNDGYHVGHYGIDLDYRPGTGRLRGTTTISATATRALSAFDLDFSGLHVTRAEVDGAPARVARKGDTLTLTPAHSLAHGAAFRATVSYEGVPRTLRDTDGSTEGWIRTRNGAVALGEPIGSMTWFPSNNHPSDKATYDIGITVPKPYKAVSNGELKNTETRNGRATFHWHSGEPMASYLATVAIGDFDIRRRTDTRPQQYLAVNRQMTDDASDVPGLVGDIVGWGSRVFGPYPFSSTGVIIDQLPHVDYPLETQTRPYFGYVPDPGILVHELAHQWYGDSVTPRVWRDIWLNEGFATYAQWLWDEQHGGHSAKAHFDKHYAQPGTDDIWAFPPGDPPDSKHLFGQPVYVRGAMTLQMLRETVGDRVFFSILRAWAAEHRHGNADTRQFIALSEKASGKNLSGLFQSWLYEHGKPDRTGTS